MWGPTLVGHFLPHFVYVLHERMKTSKYDNHLVRDSRFGRLVSTGLTKSSGGQRRWLFRCDCGKEVWVAGSTVVRGLTKSCGCLAAELSAERATGRGSKNGLTTKALFRVWRMMMARCYSPTSPSYPRYGGRGIAVEHRWHDPHTFYSDNQDRWKPGLQLDRVDNNGNYSLRNTRFVTVRENQRNRSDTIWITINNETRSLPEWCEVFGINSNLVRQRITRDGKSAIEALTGVKYGKQV